jgi:hypothetical protein
MAMGMGMGKGMGMGRGMGRGRGMGMGRGRGMGMGRGMGVGIPPSGPTSPRVSSPPPATKEEELRMLKEQSDALRSQLNSISQRIEQIEKK